MITGIALLIVELLLRSMGFMATYSEKRGAGFHTYYGEQRENWFLRWMPNDTFLLDYNEFKFGYITNSLGYRERAMNFGDSSDIRVLAFGDSFTEGIGADSTETWPRYLENMLRNSEGHPQAIVLNFGHAGSDPFYYLKELEANISELKPTHVLVSIGASDFDDYLARGGEERFQPDGTTRYRKGPWFLPLYRHSRLARYAIHQFGGYAPETLIRTSQLPALDNEAAREIVRCMNRMNQLCRGKGIKFMAFTFPHPSEACFMDYDHMRIHVFENYRSEMQFDFMEIASGFAPLKEDPKCMDYSWPMDGHYNSRGYLKLATILDQEIRSHDPGFWAE
jgi:lysophospholipase L1-like esterase